MGALDLRQFFGAPHPRWVMEGWRPVRAICMVTSDSWLSFSELKNVWGQSLGTSSKTEKLAGIPEVRKGGTERKAQGYAPLHLPTCVKQTGLKLLPGQLSD